MTIANDFEIMYHDEVISVNSRNNYRLSFPGNRWLTIHCYPDDTQTTPVENANISYSLASVWVVEEKSPGPDFLTNEEVQVIGELIKRKEIELNNADGNDK
jgi:hypothetical protein